MGLQRPPANIERRRMELHEINLMQIIILHDNFLEEFIIDYRNILFQGVALVQQIEDLITLSLTLYNFLTSLDNVRT
jgi:cell division protein FtsB